VKSETEQVRVESALKMPPSSTPNNARSAGRRPSIKAFVVFAAILVICFVRPLLGLLAFAKSELYSYIFLIPFVSGYLIKTRRAEVDLNGRPDARWALISLMGAAATFAGYRLAIARGWSADASDYFAAITLTFLFILLAGGFFFLGAKCLRAIAFPVAFAFFIVPLPEVVLKEIEAVLQHGSASIAAVMFTLSGMPVFQDDTYIHLPGFSLQVAPECSGIHSSLILFITSLIAGYLFFKSNWRRLALALAVIPLAFLRNGFRIFTIGQLCVRISPAMIDSPIHHHGGPIFFALSLVPLLLFLVWLRKGEVRKHP
jgi:exosortase C (VPDSG-CTERM-specific)